MKSDIGTAPYWKSQLLKQISSSPLFSLWLDESSNFVLQKSSVDVINIRFWIWLQNTENHLESGLVDAGATTSVMVSADKKRKFQG